MSTPSQVRLPALVLPAVAFPVLWLARPCPAAEPGGEFGDGVRPPVAEAAEDHKPRTGRVRVVGRSLADDGGPFLGLGASYFTALRRCKHDRRRLESDLAFLSARGFNAVRVLSMVGHHPAWEGLEVAPVPFTTRDGRRVEAWRDYWQQLRELIDVAYDGHGLRTELTVFADAQLMPDKADRLRHLERLLTDVLPGREHKLLLIEVANEAWQNGFPGEEGAADLREFAAYLGERTDVPVAVTSDHDRGGDDPFGRLYAGSAADLATWHFSRDRRADGGWRPVVDCWELARRPGFPPVVSNEPIGPGSSVDAETDPARLVAAAAFAYAAGLPAYVFHSKAGVFGRARFEETPGVGRFGPVLRLLPADLPDWERHDGTDAGSPLTVFAGGEAGKYVSDAASADDGCARMAACRRGDRFVAVPVGIRPGGLTVEARVPLELAAHDPLTGEVVASASLAKGERRMLPRGPGVLIVAGRVTAAGGPGDDAPRDREAPPARARDASARDATEPRPVGAAGPKWALTFRDEFDGDGLDPAKWETHFQGRRTNDPELQYYAEDGHEVRGGVLRLKAEKRAVAGKAFTSGMVASFGKFSQMYGYFEVRARCPRGKGLWSAFWLLPEVADRSKPEWWKEHWPREIDVLEMLGHEPEKAYFSVHRPGPDGGHAFETVSWSGPDFSAGFHTFAVRWEPGECVWYVDGAERAKVKEGVPNVPMFPLANLAVGGDWPGSPDAATGFPASMDVDYVRVWRRAE